MPVEAGERGERVLVGGARVDDDRLAELGGELELRLEEAPLRVVRRVVAEVVEPRLADGDGALVRRAARASSSRRSRVRAAGVVRVDAEARRRRRRARSASASASRAPAMRRRDGDHAVDTGRPRAGEHLGRLVGVEVRVRVDHARASSSSTIDVVELAEERPRLAQRLAGRELARLPACRSSSRSRR